MKRRRWSAAPAAAVLLPVVRRGRGPAPLLGRGGCRGLPPRLSLWPAAGAASVAAAAAAGRRRRRRRRSGASRPQSGVRQVLLFASHALAWWGFLHCVQNTTSSPTAIAVSSPGGVVPIQGDLSFAVLTVSGRGSTHNSSPQQLIVNVPLSP